MKRIKNVFFLLVIGVLMAGLFTECKPYDKPEYVTIEASQTAFLIPLVGDTLDQASFASEELLSNAKVASKQIQIPHRWVQTGYGGFNGEYIPSAKLIIVERKPETREWTGDTTTGSDSKNQAISAESKESIAFTVGMNCSAQIDEESDAIRFLYRYNNKTLAEIMDTEIRARVESDFVEQCSKYSLTDILLNKTEIMKAVRSDVEEYFKDRGILITVLGMKDGLTYTNKDIQTAIDDKFASEQRVTTQKNENDRIISEAEAKAKANEIINASLNDNLISYENMKEFYSKWNGTLPNVMSDGTTITDVSGK